MKRRSFLKGSSLLFFSSFIPKIIPDGFTPIINHQYPEFAKFMNQILMEIASSVGIPKEIIEMEFNKEYSLSRQVLSCDFDFFNLTKHAK